MKKNTEKLNPNCDSGNELLEGSKTKTNNEILEVFSDSDGGVIFFNYCKDHGIERKDGKELGYKNCMDTSAVYIDKEGKEYKLYSSGADSHEDVGAAAEYAFVEISEDTEQQENPEKDEELIPEESTQRLSTHSNEKDGEDQSKGNVEYLLNGKQINWMGNYIITERLGRVLIIVDDNGKYGVANLKGEKIVECEYDIIDCNGRMKKGNKYGLISETGEIMKSARYDSINYNVHDKTFLVKMDGKRGILDNQGNEILECILTYDCIVGCGKGVYIVQKDGKCGVIDNKGNLILPVQYDNIFDEQSWSGECIYEVSLHGKYGLVNGKGQLIIPIKYDMVLIKSKGNCCEVELNGKRGIIDSTGGEILPIEYEEIDTISKGKYKVKSAGLWRIVNNKGETIEQLQYKERKELDSGVYKVELDGKYGLVDSHGREILPLQYSHIQRISKGIYEVGDQESNEGVVDKNGVEIIPVIYKELEVLKSDKNLLIVKNKSGKYGIINMKNEIIIPFEFDRIREENIKTGKFGREIHNIYVQKEGRLGQLAL